LNAGLGKNVAVLSVAPKHTSELLSATPFEAEGPAADSKRPLAVAAYLDWASVVEAASPWVEYTIRQAFAAHRGEGSGLNQAERDPESMRDTLTQVHSFLDVLK